MAITITIKKEIQQRMAILTQGPGGVRVQCFADGIRYLDFNNANETMGDSRSYAESVQLGGVVHWQRQGESWHSDTVLTDTGGQRIQGHELDLARRAYARKRGQ
jgi:hypothetical protein